MDKIVLFKYKYYSMMVVAALLLLVLGAKAINMSIELSETINEYKALYLEVTEEFDYIYIDPLKTYDQEEIVKIVTDLDLRNEEIAHDINSLHQYIIELSDVSYLKRSHWGRKYYPIADSYYSLQSLVSLSDKYRKPVDYNNWVQDSDTLRECFLKIQIDRYNFGKK